MLILASSSFKCIFSRTLRNIVFELFVLGFWSICWHWFCHGVNKWIPREMKCGPQTALLFREVIYVFVLYFNAFVVTLCLRKDTKNAGIRISMNGCSA